MEIILLGIVVWIGFWLWTILKANTMEQVVIQALHAQLDDMEDVLTEEQVQELRDLLNRGKVRKLNKRIKQMVKGYQA